MFIVNQGQENAKVQAQSGRKGVNPLFVHYLSYSGPWVGWIMPKGIGKGSLHDSITTQRLHFFNRAYTPLFTFDSNWLFSAPWLTCLLLPCISTPLILKSSRQWGSDQHQIILGTNSRVCWSQKQLSAQVMITARLICVPAPGPEKLQNQTKWYHGANTSTRFTDQLPPHTDQSVETMTLSLTLTPLVTMINNVSPT